MTDRFIDKYRPRSFAEVVGQEPIVKSLQKVLKDKSSQAFLFIGPSGTGKTTLARIIATEVGCAPQDLLEIDAATHTGIDAMRSVTSGLIYKPFSQGAKAIIVDECHALSKNAWQSLLKTLEEPPAFVWWFLCATEPTKVPKTVQTRCTTYNLKSVQTRVLEDLLIDVAKQEKLKLDDGIIAAAAKAADGSPRQALSNLAVVAGAGSLKEAKSLLQTVGEDVEAFQLAQALVKGASWREVQQLLQGLSDTNPETVRHVVRAYVSKVALNAGQESAAGRAIEILDAFAEPFNSQDGLSPVILACGRLLLAE